MVKILLPVTERDIDTILLDVNRAFLYGEVRRNVCAEHPRQGPGYGYMSVMRRLRQAIFGARGARLIWGDTVKRDTESLGRAASELHPPVDNHQS